VKKIVAVCGQGIGTSVLLKMNVEKVLRKLGITAQVTAADIQMALSTAEAADILCTSADLASEFTDVPAQVVVIDNFTNLSEIESKLGPLVAE